MPVPGAGLQVTKNGENAARAGSSALALRPDDHEDLFRLGQAYYSAEV